MKLKSSSRFATIYFRRRILVARALRLQQKLEQACIKRDDLVRQSGASVELQERLLADSRSRRESLEALVRRVTDLSDGVRYRGLLLLSDFEQLQVVSELEFQAGNTPRLTHLELRLRMHRGY